MQRYGSFWLVARITGPTHNSLLIDLREDEPADSMIVAAEPTDGEVKQGSLDPTKIKQSLLEGIQRSNEEFGTRFWAKEARYFEGDTPGESVYAFLAERVIRHIVEGRAEPSGHRDDP
ncbi:MAG TPA: hypothetical protein VG820_02240 [Fimbriimonadaceae bacterium]|nr:hypothetical protein [Fimbriimonadaceae bacterium]